MNLSRLTAAWRSTVPLHLRDKIASVRRRLTPFAGTAYYSGEGEDAIMVSWLRRLRGEFSGIRYLDIGACHPIRLSNTYMLYRLGARGVLVEPDPDRARALKEARPRDIVVNAGVSFDDRKSGTLFRLTNPVFNTFSEERAEGAVRGSRQWPENERQQIVGRITVPLIPVNEIISAHLADTPPHLLSIDTEGCDFAILERLDFGLLSSPCLICIEGGEQDLVQFLQPKGFQLVAETPSNWIFIRRDRAA